MSSDDIRNGMATQIALRGTKNPTLSAPARPIITETIFYLSSLNSLYVKLSLCKRIKVKLISKTCHWVEMRCFGRRCCCRLQVVVFEGAQQWWSSVPEPGMHSGEDHSGCGSVSSGPHMSSFSLHRRILLRFDPSFRGGHPRRAYPPARGRRRRPLLHPDEFATPQVGM